MRLALARPRRGLRFAVLLLLVSASTTCDGGGGTGPGDDGIGPTGGTVSLASGAVTLSIPAGALSAPVEFTATPTTAVPASDLTVPGSTYEIGPSGTTFAVPVTLTLSYDPADLPVGVEESELRLHKVVGSEWELLASASVDLTAHTASGGVTSLSRFGVRGFSVGSVEVSPTSSSLDPGGTVQLTATPRTHDGRSLDSRPVHWSSSDEGVATVDNSGLVTAVAEGTATITAMSGGRRGTATITVYTALTITTTALPDALVGTAYSQTLAATGGDGSYTWTISVGTLPAGMALDTSTGVISGTPTTAGTSSFNVQVASGGLTAAKEMSVTVEAGDIGIGFGDEQFALIPAGTYQMGDLTGNGQADQRPVHTVNFTQSFYMQRTEVTQAQWQAVMGSNPSNFSSCGDTCPVEEVSWEDTQTFLATLNAHDPGKNYRLPTEAEWEYAARAGTTADYGGTGVLDEMGWYASNSNSMTHPVAQKQANAWGLYDTHGNVWEWVQDWFSSSYYEVSPTNDPQGPAGPLTYRVLRGGSWSSSTTTARSAFRNYDPPQAGTQYGFRLVRTP